jgi:hypothetical protein
MTAALPAILPIWPGCAAGHGVEHSRMWDKNGKHRRDGVATVLALLEGFPPQTSGRSRGRPYSCL